LARGALRSLDLTTPKKTASEVKLEQSPPSPDTSEKENDDMSDISTICYDEDESVNELFPGNFRLLV